MFVNFSENAKEHSGELQDGVQQFNTIKGKQRQ